MLLTQILIRASSSGLASPLPPIVQQNVRSLSAAHPGWPHCIFSHDDIRDFLRDQFPAEVSRAFAILKPFAYKADLARYCLLYQSGGIYADLSYYFTHPLPTQTPKLVVFRDLLCSSPWDTSNGVFHVPPRHRALAHAIERVCANVQRGYYGATPWCPTGPALFGQALARTCEAEDLITGTATLVPRATLQSLHPDLLLPEGELIHCLTIQGHLIAIKRKAVVAPGLESLGIADGNMYRAMWGKRDIYDSAAS
ncbi:MAG: glycosyltransferase [Burkholderiaceae bacterium]